MKESLGMISCRLRCAIDVGKNEFQLRGRKIPCVDDVDSAEETQSSRQPGHCFINVGGQIHGSDEGGQVEGILTAAEAVQIQPESEQLVEVRLIQDSATIHREMLVEPLTIFENRHNLKVASVLINLDAPQLVTK